MAAEYKPHYSSTVFACEQSSDTRYIRCDFPLCSEHGQAKPSWILNTLKNVRILENHVGKEIHNFMKSQSIPCVFADSLHKTKSKEIIDTNQLPTGTKKVLAVFNLKDSQSQLGDWLAHFLDAAFLSEYGNKRKDFVVITQDFVSRYELMKSIANLDFLKSSSPKVEVICILSCHSSSQGQVFSCTSTDISKIHGFEEFCSLHDFTLACQDAFQDVLTGIHVSSCFALKLDCSHQDWPVDYSWFKTKLKCPITGSVREVYETGSQICDLHIVLSTILSSPISPSAMESCGERLQKAVYSAKTESFPDLAREMGLEILDGNAAESKVLQQGMDDQVSPPIQVDSEVFVALLVEQGISSEEDPSVALSKAITANLHIRQASDIRCSYMVLPITIDNVSSIKTKSSLKEKLNELPINNCKVLFVVLSPSLANPSTGLRDAVKTWSSNRGGNKVYGIHLQSISALQAYYIKNRLKEEVALSNLNKNAGDERLEHLAITGLVDNTDNKPHITYPVLLYLIHLAIGENGYRQPRKRLSTGIYANKPLVPGTSHWTLEEVYMETCHVLSGLARKCSLQVLSLPDSSVTMDTRLADHASIPYCSTLDDNGVVLQERPSSSVGIGTPRGLADTGLASDRTDVQQCNKVSANLHSADQSSSMCKRSIEDDGTDMHEAKKILMDEFLEEYDYQSTSVTKAKKDYPSTPVTKTEKDIDSCSLNMSTTNKCKGASKVPYFKTSNVVNPEWINNSIIKPTKEPQSLDGCCEVKTEQRGQDTAVIVIDEDDCISCNDSNSKGIQADFAPLSTSALFYSNLRRTGKVFKRLNVPNLDDNQTLHDHTTEQRKKKKKKHKVGRITENNMTIEHLNIPDNKKTSPESLTPTSPILIDQEPIKDMPLLVNDELDEKSLENQTPLTSCSPDIHQESTEEIPLHANVDEVLVTHYVLDLSVDFDNQVMKGTIVLFIEPANEEASEKSFHLCLDSTLVNIQSVSEVFLPDNFNVPFFGRTCDQTDTPRLNIQETKDNKGSVKTVIEILDDDDDDDVQSPDQSDASAKTLADNIKDETSFSLFQRLEQNYGIGIEDPIDPSKDSKSDSSSNTRTTSSIDIAEEASLTSTNCSNTPSSLPEFLDLLNGKSSSQQPLSFQGLKYSVYGWCVKVNKEGATGKSWPRCICIKYQTSPEGQSLTWTKDQDGRPCVFSPGAYINNRSLMPGQEPPVAMSTWQAAIHVPEGCMVYMSGYPVHSVKENSFPDQVTHYYEMDTALPCSTLALAVGWFTYRNGPSVLVPTTQGSHRHIPCRVIAVPSLIEEASAQLLEYSSKYLVEACKLLGPYPFDRLDLLILPRCFACMGLKSPNLAFLSQSILSSDGSLRLRVAHEVTHAWFGLLIGTKDWTEEWLSEGFATYLEDTVQSRAEHWPEIEDQHYREIRQVLRYRTLSSEMQVTDKDMQCLRPNKTKLNRVERAEETTTSPSGDQPAPSTIIKYKCSKKWTQVHYLKGYFLLIHMESIVGREPFEEFLHDYVQYYQGQLVTSEDFFGYFMLKFPMLEGAVEDNFIREWLEGSGMPRCLRRKNFASNDNVLVHQAIQEFEFWRRQDATNKRNKSKHAKNRKDPDNCTLENSEQIVLMLEKLLQRDKILHSTLRQMNKVYQFALGNAEIRHRWCELVVKHKYTAELQDVKHFLVEDQGMGIYLFGELIISGQGKQRALAEEVFQEIGPEMDRCTFKTVTDMLQGVD